MFRKLPVFIALNALWVLVSICSAQNKPLENSQTQAAILQQVAYIHGGDGPFAVAGFRMGERALKELAVSRGAFTLEVVHKTPLEVQWSCIADGVQAATGASVGKLNLKLVESSKEDAETIITDRSSGKQAIFRLNPAFVARFLNLPYAKLNDAGKQVLSMRDEEIFSVVVASSKSAGNKE